MQKRQGNMDPQAESTVERMERPPARPNHAADTARSMVASDAAPHGDPILAHHNRVSAVHAEFLRTQEKVHLEFLAHRARLLEWLEQVAGQPVLPEEPRGPEPVAPTAAASTPPASTPSVAAAAKPGASTAPEAAPVATQTVDVTWDDRLLDSHVMPLGTCFSFLGRVVARADAPFGVLECELRCSLGLAVPGDTIVSDLAVTPPSKSAGEAPFRLSCRVREAARPLAEMTGLYSRSTASGPAPARGPTLGAPTSTHAPHKWTTKLRFAEQDLGAIFGGNILPCFGAGFERAASHTRTPPLPGATLVRLTSVSSLEPTGGPWSMGALRAQAVPDVGDTLPRSDEGLRLGRVYQGAQQMLAFFAMAAGETIARDGWRFEAPEGIASRLRFFDVPEFHAPLDYELVVESLDGGPWSTVVGDVRAWCGGKLVFQGERLALRLVADFPLTSNRALQADGVVEAASGRVSAAIDGFRLNYSSMLAGAVGRPTDAFNQAGAFFETGERQMPRLPGPPYHFVTRVTKVQGDRLSMRPGAEATMEYDVPPDAWYFDENGNRTMPWCVLLEIALQPCGWLSVYVGCPLMAPENVFFRNLDGTGKMTGEVFPDSGTVRTHTKVTSVSSIAGITLISYKIECSVGDREVCNLTAGFGYFPAMALDAQSRVGLPTSPEQRARLIQECPLQFDLTDRPERYCAGPLRLAGPMMLMIDRITGFWREEGTAGKGRIRAEKTVKPTDWFFKSHFYSDPVQPGTLGLEMMLQTLQFYVLEEQLHKGIEGAYFEPLALDAHVTWKYRGQVRPENKRIVAEMDIISVESTADGLTVTANGSLWVDGARCYEAKAFGVRVRGHRPVRALPSRIQDTLLDPAVDRWVTDHRPSYTLPVMPMMSLADRLAGASLEHVRAAYPPGEGAPEWVITGGQDFRAHGWLICDRPKRLRTDVRVVSTRAVHRIEEAEALATLYDLGEGGAPPRRVASGRVRLARRWPTPPPAWGPLEDGVVTASPYESGSIFWGPRLQILRHLLLSARGASAQLDAAGADAPVGAFHHILLDGALHGVPHDELERWSDKISPGHMGVPVRLAAQFFGPPPVKGIVRAEVRFAGFDGAHAFPTYAIQMIDPEGRVWATLRHVEMLIPFGHRGLSKANRIPFLVERSFREGAGLSEFHSDRTELRAADLKRLDGLPGSVAHVYGLERDAPIDLRVIAIKDHVAQRARVHPENIHVDTAKSEAWCVATPDVRYSVFVEQRDNDVIVRDA
jgi:3-hydroxymyristoyl/3-hydroxydecanoyl-(acyl carrier protein) dehydratase